MISFLNLGMATELGEGKLLMAHEPDVLYFSCMNPLFLKLLLTKCFQESD